MQKLPSLDAIRAADASSVGAKAATLGELRAAGFTVPSGFVIPAQTFVELDRGALRSALDTAIAAAEHRGPFAVRSSASVEDGVQSSYAGQFRSELNVAGHEVLDAALRCAGSAGSDMVATYESAHGISSSRAQVSVIVQAMVAADLAGVMFTADPVTGDPGTMVLELVEGLGDRLVGGLAEPVQIRMAPDGLEVAHRPVWWADGLSARVLRLCGELQQTAHMLQTYLQGPQDIELCITSDDRIVIVQSRPITTIRPVPRSHKSFTAEWISVTVDNVERIHPDLRRLDKVKLRLIASRHSVDVGRAWLLSVTRLEEMRVHSLVVPREPADADQISFVLQDPPRHNGAIVRRFSSRENRSAALADIIELVGGTHASFTLIATEILSARLSGIARAIGNRVVIEVGFGAFVPKGVVVTSQYIMGASGDMLAQQLNVQQEAVVIVGGESRLIEINETPTLSDLQQHELCQLVAVANQYYASPSVEFGIDQEGKVFLIDFVDETVALGPANDNLDVISPGRVVGRTRRIEKDSAHLLSSLEAHFHSNRDLQALPSLDVEPLVVASPLPYLSLEMFIRSHGSKLGFLFRTCSYLSHLAIVMRELGIPAVVHANAFESIREGQIVELDSAADPFVRVQDET